VEVKLNLACVEWIQLSIGLFSLKVRSAHLYIYHIVFAVCVCVCGPCIKCIHNTVAYVMAVYIHSTHTCEGYMVSLLAGFVCQRGVLKTSAFMFFKGGVCLHFIN